MKTDIRPCQASLSLVIVLTLSACSPKGDELYARAAASLEGGDAGAAVIDLKNLVQSEPQNPKARALLGRVLVASGQVELGEVEIVKAKELGAPAAVTLVPMCDVYVAKAQFEQALAECKPESGTPEQKFDLQVAQGNALLGLGRARDARPIFQAASAAKPDDLSARLGLVNAVMLVDGIDAAKAELAKASASTQERMQYWMALGSLNMQSGAFAEAEKAYQTAVDKVGDNGVAVDRLMALGSLADSQIRQGNVAAADATTTKLMKLAPKNPLVRQLRAQVAAAGGNLEEARSLLEKVVADQPKNPDARLMLGVVNYQQGNLDQAEMHIQAVVTDNPQNARAQQLLAEVRGMRASPADSMAAVETALEQTSNDPAMLAVAGKMSLASGNREQALAYLAEAEKKGKDLSPGDSLEIANGYLLAGEADKALEVLRSIPDGVAASNPRDSLLLLTLLRKGDEAQLMAQAKAMLARSGKDPTVRNLVGSVYSAAGKPDLALEQFNEALKLDAGNKQALLNLAKLEYARGKLAASEAHLKKLLELDPKNLPATLAMAAVATSRKDTKAAETHLLKARADHPESVDAQVALAQHYMAGKDTAKAKAVMDQAVEKNPSSAPMANARGVIMIAAGDAAASVASFEQAVRIDSSNLEYTLNLARARTINKDASGGLRALDDALRVSPKSLPVLGLAANLSLRQGNVEKAAGYVERVRQVAPSSPLAYQLEGDLAMMKKRYGEAAGFYEKADPGLKSRSVALARYGAAQRARLPQPEKILDQWLAAHPDDADVFGMLAESKRAKGDVAGAIAMYEQAVAKAPNNGLLLNNLAMIYVDRSDPRALVIAEKAHQLLPDVPQIQDTYGWALFKAGKPDKAIELMSQAVKGLPDNAEVQYHYAEALAAVGRKGEAMPAVKKALAGNLPPALRSDATKLLADLQ